tara:strand:+ start:299 stop:448 length:150 start_codon:yes stop_codon:yes gene_type:complete
MWLIPISTEKSSVKSILKVALVDQVEETRMYSPINVVLSHHTLLTQEKI